MAAPRLHTRLRQTGRPNPAAEPEQIRALRRELESKNARLQETLLNLDNLLSPSDWLDAGQGFPGFGTWRFARPVHRAQDRTHAPLNYLNEEEWRLHVAQARDLVTRNELGLGFRDHITNFIGPVSISFVRTGQNPGASASGPSGSSDPTEAPAVDPLVREATQAWEEWCKLAEWGQGEDDREEECRRRLMVEGEATLRFFRGDSNSADLPYCRHVEPELIRTPPGHTTLGHWGWGVRTDDDDDECELGLWMVRPENVNEGRVVEAGEYVRTKNNVDRTIRRGLSDFFPVGEQLRKILGLHENMAHVARLQAAIAWWEEYGVGVTLDQVNNAIRMGADYQRPKLAPNDSGAQSDVTSYEAGTVVKTENGRKVTPGPTSQPDGFAQISEVVLLAIGFRWGCPGYFTGKGAEAFASVLVTGSPFVRLTENRQKRMKAFCVKVAERVLEFAERSGRLPAGTCRAVRPVATAKPVVIADEEKKARTFLSLYEKNCADPIEYIRSTGADPKVVAANIQAWQKKFPAGAQPGAAPAVPGAPAPGPSATPPGSAGGDGSSPNANAGDIFGEGLVREGFTGTIKDAKGRERHYVDGKQVAAAPAQNAPANHPLNIPNSSTNHPAAAAATTLAGKLNADTEAAIAAIAPRDSVVPKRAPKEHQTTEAQKQVSVAHRRRALHGLRNEAELSSAIGGHNLPDSEPADVVHMLDAAGRPITKPDAVRAFLKQREEAVRALQSGNSPYTGQPLTDDQREGYQKRLSLPAHFIEVKTLVTNKQDAVRMSRKAQERKERWMDKYGVSFSVVAVDDRKGSKHSGHRVYVLPHSLAGTVRLDQMKKVPDMKSVLAAVKGGAS